MSREQLPALEYVMQKRMGRTNVGVMMSGGGNGRGGGSVFDAAERFVKERRERYAPVWAVVMLASCLLIMQRCLTRSLNPPELGSKFPGKCGLLQR